MTDRTEAQRIAEALQQHLPIALGSLCVWGDWFGKPGDNIHVAIGATALDDTLVVDFQEGEVLTVLAPSRGSVGPEVEPPKPRLRIEDAERVEWGWFVYGPPRGPDSWIVDVHWRDGDAIKASTTADWSEPAFAPSVDEPAVAFL